MLSLRVSHGITWEVKDLALSNHMGGCVMGVGQCTESFQHALKLPSWQDMSLGLFREESRLGVRC